MPTPSNWGLNELERLDVNQADIAPLMSTLLGLPCPVNSVGNLPVEYISFNEMDEVEAVLANTKQILSQFLRKSQLKQSHSLWFKPFKPLANHTVVLDQIEYLISVRNYKDAKILSENLRSLALEGLHYFQTYDWLMLMSVISLGYLGWMIYLVLHVLQSYTMLSGKLFRKEQSAHQKVYLFGFLMMSLVSTILLVEHAPPLYHAYFAMTVFLWVQISCEYQFLIALWRYIHGKEVRYFVKFVATLVVSVFILEMLVRSFMDRKLYTWSFLIVGIIASLYLLYSLGSNLKISVFVWLACWFLSIFTLMPAQIPDNTKLVVFGGFMIVVIGSIAKHLDMHAGESKYLVNLTLGFAKSKFNTLFLLQIILVIFSSIMVPLSTSHRTENQELHTSHQLINWSISGVSLILPLFSSTGLLSRLISLYLGFAPAFLLLSIGYEALFYGALTLALMAWILFENAYLNKTKMIKPSNSIDDELVLSSGERCLQLSDMRIPLAFMAFFNIAFFGTGNFASIASFEISSVYRFITVFSPFLMASLLIFKLLIPFVLVICAFTAITKLIRVPLLGCYFLVIICSDVMTIHFFFLVRNVGSWMEIGNSISHFGIMSAQVVFVLLLFALTTVYTKDIQTTSSNHLSRKQM